MGQLRVRFWGVRGSYPRCGSSFVKVGGNTVCVTLDYEEQYLILDAGTGLIDVGDTFINQGIPQATILISHPHLDHIHGLPFFKPIHVKDFDLTLIAGGIEAPLSLESILSVSVSPPYFPVPWEDIASKRTCIDIDIGALFSVGDFQIITHALDHPGGSCGYRIQMGDRSICYITDYAHTPGQRNESLIRFIQDADLVIYDAAFTEEEFAARPTWGHSTWNEGVALAKAASVGELALFHHSPEHDDAFMKDIENQAKKKFSGAFVACEGMEKVYGV